MSRVSGWRIAAAAIVAVVAAVGVGVAPAASPPKQDLTSGSFSMAMNLAFKPGFDILIKNFNNIYPNIKVNPTYLSVGGSAPYGTVLLTELAGGNAPDVLWTVGGRQKCWWTQVLAAGGYLDPLDGRPWVKWIPPASKSDYIYKGHIYSSELGTTAFSVMTYNKDYFQQHGLKVPQTFAQLLGLCKTISAQGHYISYGAIGAGGATIGNITSLAVSDVWRTDPKWFAQRLAHQTTFEATPGWHRALQQMLDMKAAGCFHQGFESVNFAQMANEFASGQAVILWTTPILLGTIFQLNPNLHFGMFPPPADKAGDSWLVMQPQGGLSLNAKASPDAKMAALKFIDFVAREKQARLFAKINFLISTFDELKSNLPAAYADLKPWLTAGHYISIPWSQNPNTFVFGAIGPDIQGLFLGLKSIDDVLNDFDRVFDQPPS
jgi:raffinose/stachyose/melibiose transport system substrate-binding protein